MIEERCFLMVYRESGRLVACLFWRDLPQRMGPATWSRYRPDHVVFTCELMGGDRDKSPGQLLSEYRMAIELEGRPPWPALN